MGYSVSSEPPKSIVDLVKYRDGPGRNTALDSQIREVHRKVGNVYMTMKAHPNYQDPVPVPGESQTAFILRAIAHLISPPQDPEESYDLECVDIAATVLAMEPELTKIWNEHELHNRTAGLSGS